MPEAKTEPTITVELNLPKSMAERLAALAEERGTDREAVVVELLKEAKPMTLAEVLAPVHEEFRRSGMTPEELDEWAESEVKAHRQGR